MKTVCEIRAENKIIFSPVKDTFFSPSELGSLTPFRATSKIQNCFNGNLTQEWTSKTNLVQQVEQFYCQTLGQERENLSPISIATDTKAVLRIFYV